MINRILLLVLVTVSVCADPENLVKLKNGSPVRSERMTSSSGRGIQAFKNIPYAEPPLGKLRFSDPVPIRDPWVEPQQKTGLIVCPQLDEYFFKSGYLGTEDCLLLSVYSPAEPRTDQPLPVMVFIHGGGFMSGTGNEIFYGPEMFLDEDVILVTGNYRLGALGFLSTNTSEFSGNYGLKDQTLILKWVQENIANFNGDPKRVTLFGESAGASSVNYHLVAPPSRGLFHAAILQSGNLLDAWAVRTPEETLRFAEKLLDFFGCEYKKGDYSTALECMREKDAKSITEAVKIYKEWDIHPMLIFTPVLESQYTKNPFVTAMDMEDPTASGDVPVIMGNTANEGCFWTALYGSTPELIADFNDKFDELLPMNLFLFDRYDEDSLKEATEKVKEFYFDGKKFNWDSHKEKLTDLLTANNFLAGTPTIINRRLSAAAKTYLYKFNYHGFATAADLIQRQKDDNRVVCHADELLYMFPIGQNLIQFRRMTEVDKEVIKMLVSLWTSFAKTGTPSANGIDWSPINQYPLDYLRIGNCNMTYCNADKKTETVMEKGYFEEAINFIRDFYNGLVTKNPNGGNDNMTCSKVSENC